MLLASLLARARWPRTSDQLQNPRRLHAGSDDLISHLLKGNSKYAAHAPGSGSFMPLLEALQSPGTVNLPTKLIQAIKRGTPGQEHGAHWARQHVACRFDPSGTSGTSSVSLARARHVEMLWFEKQAETGPRWSKARLKTRAGAAPPLAFTGCVEQHRDQAECYGDLQLSSQTALTKKLLRNH